MLLLIASTARAADCTTRVSASALAAELDTAERAYATLDVVAFSTALDAAAMDLPCLGELVPPTLASRYHRDVGLRLFIERDEDRAARAFASARVADASGRFPDGMLPPGHAVLVLLDAREPGPTLRIAEPIAGSVALDGTVGLERPSERPSLVQVMDGDGAVIATRYLFPSDAMPPYPAKALPAVSATSRPRVRTPVLVTSGASAVAAGVLYGLAASAESQFKDASNDATIEELDALRETNHAMVWTSAGFGAVAVAGGAIGVFFARW